jgi:serine/threonine protein kinase
MGQVYLAASPIADRVAIKVVKPALVAEDDVRRRFTDEIGNLRMVYGARVARFEDVGVGDDPPWFAVEYVPGPTLREHVEVHGPLDVALVAILGAALAEGLGKIHQAGVLHRDLKPQNIMLGPDGPKVIDFGLAVLAARTAHLTESGHVVGTLAYMPPEQAGGAWQLTPAADVYALGATLAYAATGSVLYPSAGRLEMLTRITDPGRHPDLTRVPPELGALFGAMVAFDPPARPGLDAVTSRLLDIATAGGESAAELRARLVAETYVEPESIVLPPDVDDPVGDDGQGPGGASGDGTAQAPPSAGGSPEGEEPAGGAGLPAAAPRAPVDVGWLVERLRADYARSARL